MNFNHILQKALVAVANPILAQADPFSLLHRNVKKSLWEQVRDCCDAVTVAMRTTHATLKHNCWSEAGCHNLHINDFSRLETTIISYEAQRLGDIRMPTEIAAHLARNQCEKAARTLRGAGQECRIVVDHTWTNFLGRPQSVEVCE